MVPSDLFTQYGIVGLLLFIIVIAGTAVFLFLKHLITLFMKQIRESEERNREVINNNTKVLTEFSIKANEVIRRIN